MISQTRKPIFLVVAGPNGAGKTTFAERHSVGTRIDPDAIARHMQPDAPAAVSMVAGRAARKTVHDHIARRQSFTVETTLSGKETFRDMRAAKAGGFTVRLEFIGVSGVQQSARRVAERVSRGGHDIPSEVIARRYSKVMENLPSAAMLADELTVRDNDGKDFRVVVRVRDGQITEGEGDVPDYLKSSLDRIIRAFLSSA